MSWIDELGLRHFDDGGESYSNEGRNYTTPSSDSDGATEPSSPTPSSNNDGNTAPSAPVSTANENVFDPGGTWNSGGLRNDTAAPTLQNYLTSGGADFLGGLGSQEPTIADYYDVLGVPAPAGDATRRALYGEAGYEPYGGAGVIPYSRTEDQLRAAIGMANLSDRISQNTLRDASGSAIVDRYGTSILTGEPAKDMLSGKISYGTVPYIYDQQSKQMVSNPGYHQWNEGDKYNGEPGYFDAKGKWQYGVAQNGMKYEDLKKYAEIAPNKGQTLIADNQTIDHAIAAMEFEKQLNTTVLPMFKGVVMSQLGPGASLAFNTLQRLGDVMAGKTTAGAVAADALIGIGAAKTGQNPETVKALLNLDWGKAVGEETVTPLIKKVVSSISEASGVPAVVVSQMLQNTGAGKSVKEAVADVVNQVTPGDPQNNVGFVAKILDNAMGTSASPKKGKATAPTPQGLPTLLAP